MPKARDKSVRLAAIGCNADEKTLAEQIAATKGITTKVLKYAIIINAVQGRIGIGTKAGELGLKVDQYRCYLEAAALDPSVAEGLRVKWAALNAAIDRNSAPAQTPTTA